MSVLLLISLIINVSQVRARSNKQYWETLNPGTGRPFSASLSKPDQWGITAGKILITEPRTSTSYMLSHAPARAVPWSAVFISRPLKKCTKRFGVILTRFSAGHDLVKQHQTSTTAEELLKGSEFKQKLHRHQIAC